MTTTTALMAILMAFATQAFHTNMNKSSNTNEQRSIQPKSYPSFHLSGQKSSLSSKNLTGQRADQSTQSLENHKSDPRCKSGIGGYGQSSANFPANYEHDHQSRNGGHSQHSAYSSGNGEHRCQSEIGGYGQLSADFPANYEHNHQSRSGGYPQIRTQFTLQEMVNLDIDQEIGDMVIIQFIFKKTMNMVIN
ncbi:hypothetical protein KQX54_009955 [Cotesia glomerata]|uniref:Uncharacterized protein n=1 Tax=Cotesia glomerata TaxID=32391 RepID=A0AAV7HWJ5_COTGL|nr:hypothetical protein KQX54_009955 [Cotesia glomerata]